MNYLELNLILIGILVVLVGFVLVTIGAVLQAKKVEWAFGGFIGPIPFGFASREDLLKLIIVFSIIVLTVFLVLYKKVFI